MGTLLVIALILSVIAFIGFFPVLATRHVLLPQPIRRISTIAIVVQFAIGIGVIGYMEVTLRGFASRAHEPIHGLIGRPVPNGGGDHAYTTHGREYEAAAFARPFRAGVAGVLAVALVTTIAAVGSRRRLAWPVWWTAAVVVALMFVFWVAREFSAWDIFI